MADVRLCGHRRQSGVHHLNNDICSCGSNKIPGALVMHEVGHALGYFHVPDRNSVMYPFIPGNCPSGQLSAAEKVHAASPTRGRAAIWILTTIRPRDSTSRRPPSGLTASHRHRARR